MTIAKIFKNAKFILKKIRPQWFKQTWHAREEFELYVRTHIEKPKAITPNYQRFYKYCVRKEDKRLYRITKTLRPHWFTHDRGITIGSQFGMLTVLEKVRVNLTRGKWKWKCRCTCGKERLLFTSQLVSSTKKYGTIASKCWSCSVNRMDAPIGKTSGCLTVIREVKHKVNQPRKVLCLCKCGKKVVKWMSSVMHKYPKTCLSNPQKRSHRFECTEAINLNFVAPRAACTRGAF